MFWTHYYIPILSGQNWGSSKVIHIVVLDISWSLIIQDAGLNSDYIIDPDWLLIVKVFISFVKCCWKFRKYDQYIQFADTYIMQAGLDH